MSTTTSKGIGNTTEAGGKRPKVYRYARLNDGMTVHPHGDWINYVDFDETAAELAALKASNAALVEALDTYRLTRNAVIAGLPFSWTDVDKVVNAALASVKS